MANNDGAFRLNINFGDTGLTKLKNRLNQFVKSDVNKAMFEQQAIELQELQQKVLKDRIQDTGRPQVRNDALLLALVSPKNRQVTSVGFKVGMGLTDGDVNLYFRGLEQGTSVHVGAVVRGYFSESAGGERHEPSSKFGRREAFFAARSGRHWVMKIEKPIRAYEYLSGGYEAWLAGGQRVVDIKAALLANFQKAMRS